MLAAVWLCCNAAICCLAAFNSSINLTTWLSAVESDSCICFFRAAMSCCRMSILLWASFSKQTQKSKSALLTSLEGGSTQLHHCWHADVSSAMRSCTCNQIARGYASGVICLSGSLQSRCSANTAMQAQLHLVRVCIQLVFRTQTATSWQQNPLEE